MFASQKEYEAYHSPEARRARCEAAQAVTNRAVSEAWQLFRDGDRQGAEQRLFDAGLQESGISYYMQAWSE